MPKRSRRSSGAARFGGISAVLLVLLAVMVLVSRGCSLRNLPEDPAGTIKTLVATLPVNISLPTDAPVEATRAQASTPISPPREQAGLEIYFTSPLDDGGVAEAQFVAAVSAARVSVDMAIYNFSLDPLADALIAAQQRGVRVRLVMESEAMERRVPQRLAAAGIPITGDTRDALMHNKFTIIDGEEVWTGSANYTASSFDNDFNNLVRIRSRQAAQSYTANFEEMFTQHLFGAEKQPNTPYPRIEVGLAVVEMYFSPEDGVAREVVDEIRGAKRSVDVLAYSFTRDDFAGAMIAQSRAGVVVRGVFDQGQYEGNTGGEFDTLRQAGLDVRLDTQPGLMHNKVMIIDGETVITGSYNFTGNAERANDENLVIIHDPAVARAYLEHFAEVWATVE
jgi:phosphatidylserine/phosphatidylglycerophosphate/cardiolipin synthase-like enzyme